MSDKAFIFSYSDKDLNLSLQMTFAKRANCLHKENLMQSWGIFKILKWPFAWLFLGLTQSMND